MSKIQNKICGYTSRHLMLAQKNSWRKDIFCDLYKKDKSGHSKMTLYEIFFCLFCTGHKKRLFTVKLFVLVQNVLKYIRFFWNFMTFCKKIKNVLHNGCIYTHDPKHRIRVTAHFWKCNIGSTCYMHFFSKSARYHSLDFFLGLGRQSDRWGLWLPNAEFVFLVTGCHGWGFWATVDFVGYVEVCRLLVCFIFLCAFTCEVWAFHIYVRAWPSFSSSSFFYFLYFVLEVGFLERQKCVFAIEFLVVSRCIFVRFK